MLESELEKTNNLIFPSAKYRIRKWNIKMKVGKWLIPKKSLTQLSTHQWVTKDRSKREGDLIVQTQTLLVLYLIEIQFKFSNSIRKKLWERKIEKRNENFSINFFRKFKSNCRNVRQKSSSQHDTIESSFNEVRSGNNSFYGFLSSTICGWVAVRVCKLVTSTQWRSKVFSIIFGISLTAYVENDM